jgi:hypothetical protein
VPKVRRLFVGCGSFFADRAELNAYWESTLWQIVLAHPRYGALVLEVKGGTLGYDALRGGWTSTDRHGEHRI